MLLEGKNAVIYGGGGAIGGAVARVFAREGTRVFLAGRTLATLETAAGEIRAAGGVAEAAEVDALDEEAVDGHADAVALAERLGREPAVFPGGHSGIGSRLEAFAGRLHEVLGAYRAPTHAVSSPAIRRAGS